MYVDATKFYKKTHRIKQHVVTVAAKEVASISQMIFDKTKKNLKGPGAGVRQSKSGLQYPKTSPKHPLQMPVRRVTGTLARSLKMYPISQYEYLIYCDPKVAHYATYVHNGTRYIKPRRFLGDVIKGNKAPAIKRLDSALMYLMRSA